jgi:hypothetical protein
VSHDSRVAPFPNDGKHPSSGVFPNYEEWHPNGRIISVASPGSRHLLDLSPLTL